jgi:hypothetical protein
VSTYVRQGLPFTTKAKVNKMKDMIDADNHFSKLQDKLHRSQPPCIPHIGTAPSSRLADYRAHMINHWLVATSTCE